jgi:hypothetical protein
MSEFRADADFYRRGERQVFTMLGIIVIVPVLAFIILLGAVWPKPHVPYTYTISDWAIICEAEVGDTMMLGNGPSTRLKGGTKAECYEASRR